MACINCYSQIAFCCCCCCCCLFDCFLFWLLLFVIYVAAVATFVLPSQAFFPLKSRMPTTVISTCNVLRAMFLLLPSILMVIKSIAYLFNKTCETVLDDVIRSTKKVEKEKRDKSNDLHQIYDRFQSPNDCGS